MEYTIEKLSSNKVKITFKTTAAEFAAAVQKAYISSRGQISVPGFRRGKAPRHIIEMMYGKEVFYSDAFESLFNDNYIKAIMESELQPVASPETDVKQLSCVEDFEYSCEVFVKPDVVLGQYKEVPVTRSIHTVTDAEVDASIQKEQKRVARSLDVTDRSLENGDKAVLDYSGTVDGVAFEGGTAENQTLAIGSGSFIPGFEEQMIGMQIGEERDLNVRFPDEYHEESLKGKDAVFHVKLHSATHEELPELDDEFAAEVSDFDTLAEYREDVRKQLQKTADEKSEVDAKNALIDTIVDNAECDVPDPMVEDKLDEIMANMEADMQRKGFSMDMYMRILNRSKEQLREMYREEALRQIKTELILDKIIQTENVEADDEGINEMLKGYAEAASQTTEQFKEGLSESQLAYVKHRVQITKLLDTLWSGAVITEQEASASAESAEDDDETPEENEEADPE